MNITLLDGCGAQAQLAYESCAGCRSSAQLLWLSAMLFCMAYAFWLFREYVLTDAKIDSGVRTGLAAGLRVAYHLLSLAGLVLLGASG